MKPGGLLGWRASLRQYFFQNRYCTAVYADKIIAVALSREKAVQLLDAKTLRCRWVLRGHATMVWSVGSSADSKHIMSACEQFIKVWEASTLKLLQCFPVHTREGEEPKREMTGGSKLGASGAL
eukprot:gene2927-16917_t